MKKKYFKLQLKSIFKVYPAILLVTVLTVLSIATTCVLLLEKNMNSEESQKISVGMVGDLEDTYLDIGLTALENIDISRFYIELVPMKEEDAVKALEKNEIAGYIYIPKNYTKNIYKGYNYPAKYITRNVPAGFGSIISDEVALLISDIVTESQNGMYSMQNVARDHNVKKLGEKINNLMILYADHILNRSDVYKVTSLGISDSLSFAGYYICGLLVIFMLLWGISCNRIFASKNSIFPRVLRISGVNAKNQILCEFGAYFLVGLMTLVAGAVLFGIVVSYNDFGIPELLGVRITDCILFVVGIVPVIAMISMMQVAFYELIPNTIGAVLAQFFTAIVLGYFSGCFYPNYFFPEIVQNISLYLPVGAGFSFVRKVMAGTVPLTEFFVVVLYLALFAFFTVKMRKYKITGDIK